MARNLEELKAQVVHLKSAAFSRKDGHGTYRASAHEKALCDLVVKLIEALEFLPDHTHHMTSGNSLRTEGPEDMR